MSETTSLIRRRMPWNGHNARVLAERNRPPRLPPNFGSTLTGTHTISGRANARGMAAVDLQDIRRLVHGETAAERTLSMLEALELRGMGLPDIEAMVALVGIEPERLYGAFRELVKRGDIQMQQIKRGRAPAHRTIRLRSGTVMRSAGAPGFDT